MSLSVITYMEKELENMYIHLCRRESSCTRLKRGGGEGPQIVIHLYTPVQIIG